MRLDSLGRTTGKNDTLVEACKIHDLEYVARIEGFNTDTSSKGIDLNFFL
jgi:hypothetical protein